MKRLIGLCCVLVATSAWATPVRWAFQFTPSDEPRPFEIVSGRLDVTFDDALVRNAYRQDDYSEVDYGVTDFHLVLHGDQYRGDSGVVERFNTTGGLDGLSLELGLGNGGKFWLEICADLFNNEALEVGRVLSTADGGPFHNYVGAMDGFGNTLAQATVRSWRAISVPEPGTLSLLMAGFLALVVLRVRKQP